MKINITLKEHQKNIFQQLVFIKNLLDEHGIKYFLLGGTALGAYRNGSIIPWDDDIDIGIFRDQYNHAEELIGKLYNNNPGFFFKTIRDGRVSKLPYNTIVPVYDNDPEVLNHIPGIDIFPLDVVANNLFKRKLQVLCANIYRFFLWGKPVKSKGVVIYFATMLLHFVTPRFLASYLVEKTGLYITSFSRYKNKFIGNLFGAHGIREIMPNFIFECGSMIILDGFNFTVPSEIEQYLTCLYGDFRKEPSPGNQIAHFNGWSVF